MQVSYNWLKDYVNINQSPTELAELLTQAGLDVDLIEYQGQGLEDIVIGEILEIAKHPNADKLSLTRVNVGTEVLEIVCGAGNIFAGAKVPIAKIGVTLPDGHKITKAKLRGVTSSGMICSEDELGLVEERQPGVMIIDRECKVGDSFIQVMNLNDIIFHLDLTPNFAHCLSMLGVAREIVARINSKLKRPTIGLKESSTSTADLAEVIIQSIELCPRYTARVIRGIKVGESPEWLQERLIKAGMRPINNVVDITNYVLMETGQPLHAFDYDKIADHKIVIRTATAGEKIVTLDDKEHELTSDVLCICDAEKPICIAGVMGGANSEVTVETRNILLESAYFDPISVRKTARRYGIPSEASHRFERGVDIESVVAASNRAAQLLQELAGGEISAGLIDNYPEVKKPLVIRLRKERVSSLLGIELTTAKIKELLERLSFVVSEVIGEDLDVTVPGFRGDVTREADLIEEVARLYGYNNIPAQLPVGKYRMGKLTPSQLLENQTREFMNAVGLNEIMSFSFVNPNIYEKLNLSDDHEWRNSIKLLNPLNEEYAVMRRTLLADLLKVIGFNVKRKIEEVQVFELSRVYQPTEADLPHEPRKLSAAISGLKGNGDWNQNAKGFYYLKGILDEYAAKFGLGELRYEQGIHDSFHPGRTAIVKARGVTLGYLAEIHPDVLANFDLKDRTTVFEIDFEKVAELVDNSKKYAELPKYPALTRDLALILDAEISAQAVVDIIKSVGSEYLEHVELFDIYQGAQVPQGKKSMAFAMSYRAKECTLTDEVINPIIEELLTKLKSKLGAEIRV